MIIGFSRDRFKIHRSVGKKQKRTPPLASDGLPMPLKINSYEQPSTLDPRLSNDVFRSLFSYYFFSGLTKIESTGQISLASAQSVHISKDLKCYTFALKDLYWSDGSNLTAQDFERSFKKILSPNFFCPFINLLFPIKNAKSYKLNGINETLGISSLDEKTLLIKLENPCVNFLEILALNIFFPTSSKMLDSDYPTSFNDKQVLIGNGPFCLKQWEKGEKITLERNPYYWNNSESKLKQLDISFISDIYKAFKKYEDDELDFIGTLLSPIPLSGGKKYAKEVKFLPSSNAYVVYFNCSSFPFNNENLRKAFHYALPRKKICEALKSNEYQPLFTPIRFHEAFNEPSSIQKEKAIFYYRQAMEEIGSDLQTHQIDFIHLDDLISQKIAHLITQKLQTFFKIKIVPLPVKFNQAINLFQSRKYQMAMVYSTPHLMDRSDLFERLKYNKNLKNYSAWEDPEYIRLLDQANSARTKNVRDKFLFDAETILLEKCPMSSVLEYKSVYLQKPHVKNISYSPNGVIEFNKVITR